ncbi:MAG: hypothetical protein ACQBVK_02290 [Candidatus Phytoplasma sp. TWB_XP]
MKLLKMKLGISRFTLEKFINKIKTLREEIKEWKKEDKPQDEGNSSNPPGNNPPIEPKTNENEEKLKQKLTPEQLQFLGIKIINVKYLLELMEEILIPNESEPQEQAIIKINPRYKESLIKQLQDLKNNKEIQDS